MKNNRPLSRVLFVALTLVATAGWFSAPQEPELSPKEQKQVDAILKIFSDMSIEGQVAAIKAQRAVLSDRLLTPAPSEIRRHAALSQLQGVGVNRLLNRGPFEGVVVGRGGGAYFSFTSQENDYDQSPDLSLSQWKLKSGFAGGDFGIVVALGEKSLGELVIDELPATLRLENPNQLERNRERPVATVGHSYVVRSVRWDESDTLTVLQVLSRDQRGISFAWRTLKTYPTPKRQR